MNSNSMMDNSANKMDMDMDMDMRMYMIINWDYKVRFIFNDWKSTTYGEFIFGLIFTLLFCITLCLIPVLKGIADKTNSLLLKIIWQLLTAIQGSLSMFLLMTVNGWVFLSMAFGIGIGNYIFYKQMPAYQKHIRTDSKKLNSSE